MDGLLSHASPATENTLPVHAADALKITTLKDHLVSTWTNAVPLENPMTMKFPGMRFHKEDESVLTNILAPAGSKAVNSFTVLRAGPTRKILWHPSEVKAAIVTCGGVCPGLNSVIRDVAIGLYANYGIREPGKVLGIRYGYNGFDTDKYPPVSLTPAVVEEIHTKGGSMLGAGRGGFKPDYIVDRCLALGINHLYVVGGDGTQWAADVLFQVVKERRLKMAIVGIPKTIDNDILFFDRSFGFHSAVDAAVDAIRSAFIEASSCYNGVGIVKLMGRDSGFVARNAALASNLSDAVLIPEVDFSIDGPGGLLEHVAYRLSRKRHAVVVVAEGAGQKYCATGQKDSTGHTMYGDIGIFLRDKINAYLKDTVGGRCFFNDPAYMIRSVPATPVDNVFCCRMAHEAVHAAMRGYSGVCVGAVHDYMVMIPMELVASGRRRVNVHSSIWQRTCEVTGMPAPMTGLDKPLPKAESKHRGNPNMFRKKPKL